MSRKLVSVNYPKELRNFAKFRRSLDSVTNKALGLASSNAKKYLAGAAKGTGKGAKIAGTSSRRFQPVWKVLHAAQKKGGRFSSWRDNSPYVVFSPSWSTRVVATKHAFIDVLDKFQLGVPLSDQAKQRLLMRFARKAGTMPRNLRGKNKGRLHKEGIRGTSAPIELIDIPARPFFEPVAKYIRANYAKEVRSILEKEMAKWKARGSQDRVTIHGGRGLERFSAKM